MTTRIDLINYVIKKLSFKRYLEIGVSAGACFNNIIIDEKVGVDPDGNSAATLKITSDEFFKQNTKKFDLIFIDGLHEEDQVLKDINNSIAALSDNGLILCHDMLPETKEAQIVPRQQDIWNGDCWKAFVKLRATRQYLTMCTIDTDYGIGVIQNTGIKNTRQSTINLPADLSYEAFVLNKKEWMSVLSVEIFYIILDYWEKSLR